MEPTQQEKPKMVIVMREDLGMESGKIGAQCSHGGKLFMMKFILECDTLFSTGVSCGTPEPLTQEQREWLSGEYKTAVVTIETGEKLQNLIAKAKAAGLTVEPIVDNGHTVVAAGTTTGVAIGPHYPDRFKGITNRLRLMKYEEEDVFKFYRNEETRCTVPPKGFWCSRQKGHEGPCATRAFEA